LMGDRDDHDLVRSLLVDNRVGKARHDYAPLCWTYR
jgi:hypothetical protein